MNVQYCHMVRAASQPLEPIQTSQRGMPKKLVGIRAVYFDIYGTLFISGSGDIGAGVGIPAEQNPSASLEASLGEVFVGMCGNQSDTGDLVDHLVGRVDSGESKYRVLGRDLITCLQRKIQEERTERQQAGIEYPEVEIVKVWRSVAKSILKPVTTADTFSDHDFEQLAIIYEVRANPVWPMPAATDCIDQLASANLTLGIISNAQFYTPFLFPALMKRTLEELAFAPEMQYYSYCYGKAKPGEFLYRQALAGLKEKGIEPHESLYVGNDMLNDIMPAARAGFRTALFAGDQRSLRLREGDPRVAGVAPDIIIKDLMSVADCVLDN